MLNYALVALLTTLMTCYPEWILKDYLVAENDAENYDDLLFCGYLNILTPGEDSFSRQIGGVTVMG